MLSQRLKQGRKGTPEEGMFTPKWHSFQEALAKILKLSIGVVTPDGSLAALYNALPPYSELGQNPRLKAVYGEFIRLVPEICTKKGCNRIIYDPLGLPVGVIPLDGGSFLILGGCVVRDMKNTTELNSRLERLGVDKESSKLWLKMTSLSLEELRGNQHYLESLYKQVYRSLDDTSDLGHQMLILSAVEEVNKLMVSTLNPEHFDLKRILDLVASSLIILADGEGALAFSCRQPGLVTAAIRGEHGGTMQALAEEWASAAARGGDPVELFSEASGSRSIEAGGMSLVFATIRRESASALLGVIASPNKHLQATLSAFSKQVAIALEVSSLYEVIQQRFGMLFNSIRQGIIATDRAGKIMLFNHTAEAIFKALELSLAVGEPLNGRGFCRQIEEAVSCAVKTGCIFDQQRSEVGPPDHLMHLRWGVSPLVRNDGSVAGTIVVFDDITEPVNRFREIQDWERLNMAIEIAAGLAHEIRNPLATAKAAIQLYEIIDDEVKRGELMGKLENELDRMNQVLTTFLSLSRPMQDDSSLQELSIVQIVEELAFLLKSEAHINEIDLELNLPEALPLIVGSENSLKQVFLNIARNAFEAMSEGGKLEISLSRRGNSAEITFRDNGPGISRENLAHITRPFFTTKLGGTGLGLSISSSIVRMMGGDMTIESKPGEGTAVTVTLPAGGDGAGPASSPA